MPSSVLERWIATPAARHRAPVLWAAALLALPKMERAVDPALRERIFDRLLDEEPASLYQAIPSLDAAHRPALLEALGACDDACARLLLAAGDAFEPAARFARTIAACTRPLRLARKGIEHPAARDPGVLAACLALARSPWPHDDPPFIAIVHALIAHADPQVAESLFDAAPGHAVGWLKVALTHLPAARAAPVTRAIAGRDVEPAPATGRRRYERLHPPPAPPTLAARRASADAALAAVYASPHEDAPRLVLADVLLERGDPLGDLIVRQVARRRHERRRTAPEKILLEIWGGRLWPDHPCSLAGSVRWEWVERGFPAVLAIAGDPPAPGAPGWATVREIRVDGSTPIEDLLASPLPSLRVLDGIDLATAAALDVGGIEELRLLARPGRAPAIGGFPQLRRVALASADPEAPIEHGLARLDETGLLTRVSGVTLRGFATAHPPAAALALLAARPALASATIDFGRDDWVRATRTAGKPELEVSMAMRLPHLVAREIREVPPEDVSLVHVILSAEGFYARKARQSNADNVRQDLAGFPRVRVTADPPRT